MLCNTYKHTVLINKKRSSRHLFTINVKMYLCIGNIGSYSTKISATTNMAVMHNVMMHCSLKHWA